MIRRLPADIVSIYNKVIADQEKHGFIELVENDDNECGHYLPHRHVRKDSATTPIRIVYDCSCQGNNTSPQFDSPSFEESDTAIASSGDTATEVTNPSENYELSNHGDSIPVCHMAIQPPADVNPALPIAMDTDGIHQRDTSDTEYVRDAPVLNSPSEFITSTEIPV